MSLQERIEEAWARVVERLEARAPAERVAEAYTRFLSTLPFYQRNLVIVTLTYAKGVWNYIPRRLVPRLLKIPEFYERYMRLTSYSEEVWRELQRVKGRVESFASRLMHRLGKVERVKTLICLPSFEPATRFASAWIRSEVSPTAHRSGLSRELVRALDNRPVFAAETRIRNFIIGAGHGRADLFGGQWQVILWKVGKYHREEAEGKMIKLLSCLCGRELGPDLVDNGALGFQGYVEEYVAMFLPRFYPAPSLDKNAEKFFEPYCDACNLLLRGGTNRAAYDLERGELVLRASVESDPEVRSFLLHDASALIMLGDPHATVPRD